MIGLILIGTLLALLAYLIMDSRQESDQMDQTARKDAPGKFIELKDGVTHYRLVGPEEGKLLVLIHGGMVSGMYAWEKNVDFLSRNGYKVLMYDLYGRGYSDRIEGEYRPDLFFRQFEELLDSLQIQEPFYLAGLSLGSMPAIEFTRTNPEQVKKLMLISPAARGKFKVHPVLEVPLLSNLLMTAYWFPRTVDNQMQEFYRPEKFPEYEAELRKMIRFKGYKSSNYSTWLNTLTFNMEPQIKEVGDTGTPVALVLGTHDPYVQPDEALVYQQLIPAIQVFKIPEAGHIVNFERAEQVNQLMLRFFSDGN